jgi:hypothetical protein
MSTARVKELCRWWNAKAAINETNGYGPTARANYQSCNIVKVKKMVLDEGQYITDGYHTQLQGIKAWADWLIAYWPNTKTPFSDDEKRLVITGIMKMAKR